MAQIKSKQRVKDFAEVFTNEREVKAMCDLIPTDIWEDIGSTFLEPACGNGNFIVEIMLRKYKRCRNETDGLKALESVTGIDIQEDNVQETRERLLAQYRERFPGVGESEIKNAAEILGRNIICGDSLKIMEEWERENDRTSGEEGLHRGEDHRRPAISGKI